ncbi:C-terminal binding protein [Devosia elaeis]|uniref:Hydroxyacid dehydrogenase n=1 Tax=Devosia elaeis TaxID=1770058 RepID=A0A178HKN1_9HYPH|nr:C-terminal binding protein [Devosia elaeis]OAM72980.1 hypothetical protein A3840_18835 [Devosia elaeis]
MSEQANQAQRRYRIVMPDPFSDRLDAVRQGLEGLDYELVVAKGESWVEEARDADGLIVNLVPVGAAELGSLARCAVIARLGTGVDSVDVAAARRRGIAVTNVPDYCSEEVSDHVLALMLSWMRHIPQAAKDMADKRWRQTDYRPIRRVSTQVMGLVGYGKLARAVARKARALGMRVIAHDPMLGRDEAGIAELMSFERVLGEADILSLHAPLTDATRGMINDAALARMKPSALLINAARGELVEEGALVRALDAGTIAGAALDVFASEPWTADSPLRHDQRVLLTPHMAFYSEESLASLEEQAARSIRDILTGAGSPNVVN